jgi:hypothetical protein
MKNRMKICTLRVFLFIIIATGVSCAGSKTATQVQSEISLLSDELRNELRDITSSIVGITTDIQYRIYKYNYLFEDGRFVPDPNSPLRYKLHSSYGENGIIVETDERTLSGGGIIIDFDRDKSRYCVLTSAHLVKPNDTTDVYYLDENGNLTDVLFARYIIKDVLVTVRGRSNWRPRAKVITYDSINDLAVLEVQTRNFLGIEFPNDVGYDLDLSWGDWVFLFGYPKGIKQMTGGWVSEAPYSGTLAVDAVVRFGFSGGPVFAISKDGAKLLLVGLIKSVPRSTLEYISPKSSLPMGYQLTKDDIENLIVKTEIMVDYGAAYFVSAKALKKFFGNYQKEIRAAGIELEAKYYGK